MIVRQTVRKTAGQNVRLEITLENIKIRQIWGGGKKNHRARWKTDSPIDANSGRQADEQAG